MTGIELIAKERQRQIDVEVWTPEGDDDRYRTNEMEHAAIAYENNDREQWPWPEEWWKPTPGDPIRQLVKSGALFEAEANRLNRRLIHFPTQEVLSNYDRVLASVKRVADKIDRLQALELNEREDK